jgi:hypothetical protein
MNRTHALFRGLENHFVFERREQWRNVGQPNLKRREQSKERKMTVWKGKRGQVIVIYG